MQPGNTYIKDVCETIEAFAPLALQESYDNSGLLVGDPEVLLEGILITLDITEETIDEAITKGLNCIVAHHPIIFHGIKKLNAKTMVERCVMKAIKHNIALYAAHTNADVVYQGVSMALAKQLALIDTQILSPQPQCRELNHNTCNPIGYGMVGYLKIPLSEQDFLAYVKEKLGIEVIKHSQLRGLPIHKVALSGGSGAFLIKDAQTAQADVFISAEFKYHEYHDAAEHLMIADIGHFESEQFTKYMFFEILQKKFSKFALCFAETSLNPVKYYK